MTREEIIRNLKYTMKKHKNDTVNTFETNISAMCKDILDYLQQEPCDDCISRQAVIDMMNYGILEDNIKELPSVTPKEKTGKWIDDEFGSKCSCCGRYTHLDKFDRPMKFMYCTMCGARMIEPQESEE